MHESMGRLYLAARQLKGADTPSEVARLLDESPQTLNNWEKRGISKNGYLKAQRLIGCRSEWLEDGQGDMSLLGISANTVRIASATGGVAVSPDYLDTEARLHTRRLPRLRWEQVGELQMTQLENISPTGFIDTPFESAPGSYCLVLEDEAMLPEYAPGAVIQVEPATNAKHGEDIVVLLPSGRAIMRRLIDAEDGQVLQALYHLWPTQLLPMPEGAKIIGLVVGVWKSSRRR